jgi:hypothetical protein
MSPPTLPGRKPPAFVRCPVCGTEFRGNLGQRWCSKACVWAAKRQARREAKHAAAAVLTPEAIRHGVDAAAGTMWRELVRRPVRKEQP